MSHSANAISNHRLHPSNPDLTPRVTEWEIHVGMTGFLYIVGPGPSAMMRAYRCVTESRLSIVRRAVILLNQTRREDTSAQEPEIRAALVEVGWQEED